MLDELLAVVERLDYTHEGYLDLSGLRRDQDSLTLNLRLVPSDGSRSQDWMIQCHGVESYSLNNGADDFQVLDDHVLLWEAVRPTVTLYLNGKPQDAMRTAWALYQRHEQVVEGWFPFEKYFNTSARLGRYLPQLLEGGHGLLARGPLPLLQEYAEVLSQAEVAFYFFPALADVKPVSDDHGLRLLLLGRSYVIGTTFEATKASEGVGTA